MAEEGPQVISVELAIQRELEYRKKVASLTGSDELMKDLTPLKVISSDPCQSLYLSLPSYPEPTSVTTAIPYPAPCSSDQLPRANPNLAPSSAYQFPPSSASAGFCPAPHQIPSWPFQSSSFNQRPLAPNHYPGHGPRPRPHSTHQPNYSGTKRKTTNSFQQPAPQKPKQPQESYIIVDSSGNMFCKLCEVPCSGAMCLKQHLKGHKHKAKLQLLKVDTKNGGEQGNKLPRCDICQIWCTNEDALKMHYQGQKHKAKVQSLETGQKSGEKGTERPWCGLCEIWCMNEDSFNQHLKGQKHITRLHSMREIEMANEKKLHSNSFKRRF